jgi:Zn finger protein HypA/HybF involved in hydrogenase expression
MKNPKYTITDLKNFAISKNGECISDIYINNKIPIKWKCNKCNFIFSNSFKNVKYLNNWCPSCSGKYNNNIEVAIKIAISKGGLCLSKEYKNNKTNLEWKCNKCQHIWKARLDRIKSGTWCPKCRRSHGELKISKILDMYNINYIHEYNIKEIKSRYDFFLPQYNMFIEFDGIQHFYISRKFTSTEISLKKLQKKDTLKTLYCLESNIKLLRIDFSNFKNIEEIILNSLDEKNPKLIFSDWKKYSHIIEELHNTNFLVFITGIGK